jgi:ADP-ribose pyrophosphatase YjhB (NUDIX family)
MKRFLLQIWRILPPWMERIASAVVRPKYRVVVGAIILNDQSQILLCRHTYRRLHPWGMPGGDIKFGEDPSDAIRRELREETGFSVNAARLLLVEGSKQIRKISLTYLCTGISGPFLPNEEVFMIQYFDASALPVIPREELLTIEKALAILKAELR